MANLTQIMQRIGFLLIVFLLTTALPSATAETTNLVADADTAISELDPDFNLGGQTDFPAGALGSNVGMTLTRALFRFDVAGALPTNATLNSAVLRLTVTRVPDNPSVSVFGLHRVLRPWGEGTKRGGSPGGAPATEGEATWNSRMHPNEPWGEPGGAPGVDYVAEPSSTERVDAAGVYEFEFGPNQLVEIEQWIRDPSTNFGWMLIAQSEDLLRTARRFAAREHAQANARPTLIIDYSIGSSIPQPMITGISVSTNATTIRSTAAAGFRYALEFQDQLGGTNWERITPETVVETDGEIELIDPGDLGPRRFYRVVALE